ncbi:FtsX-like permease family protein [bacterium]|nr:FtsX-like permease family protein [bacterium]
MKPRWRKVIADLWGNKARFVLVVLSLTVGLFSVGMIAGGYVTILEDMQTGYRDIHPADLRFVVDPFDEELIERIKRVDGVAAADAEARLRWQFQNGEGEWQNLSVRVMPDDGQTLDRAELQSGVMPGEFEIALDQHKETHLNVGDTVLVQLPSGTQRELTLTGIVRDQTIGALSTNYFVAPTFGYVTYESLPWLEEERSYDNLLVEVQPDLSAAEIEQVSQDIIGVVEQSGRSVDSSMNMTPTRHPNRGYVEAISGLLALLAFFSVFLSGFLVFNSMAALFAQQTQYIGIMKGIGAQRKTIVRMYMIFILIFSLVATAIAIPSSARAWSRLSSFFSTRMNYVSGGFRYVLPAVLLQLVIGLILPQAAGFLPTLRASKISVQEAIAQTGIESDKFDKSWLDRQLEKVKRLSRPVLIAIRNTFRRKSRLILTLITLSLGGALFIASFNVRASLESYVEQVSKYILADVSVDFERNYRIDEIENIALTIPGVQSVEPRGGAYCQLVNENGEPADNVEMLGAPPESNLIEPVLIEGRWLIPGDENAIVLNEAFLTSFPGLGVGDTLTLFVNQREVDWTVVGFFQFIGNDSFLVYVPLGHLNEVTGNTNQASNFQIVASPDMTEQQVSKLVTRVDTTFREKGFHVSNASSSDSLIGNATLGLDTLTIFLLIVSGLIALVGSIGLTGTMSMNVMERTREIGVMRAIGATDSQVMRQVIIEGTLIGLLSWVIAFGLAFPLSSFMSYIVNVSIFGVTGSYAFTATGFLIWFGIVGILSLVASILPARNAARLTIREVLAYE